MNEYWENGMKKDNKTIDLVQVLEGHISVEELREVFFYRDGFLHYRKNKKCAGYPDPQKKGYLRIQYNGKKYYSHRLIWMYHKGYITDDLFVDHKDGDRSNSRIENLRLLNPKENSQNRQTANKNSLSGFAGVSAVGNRYRARINHEGKTIHLGFYANPVEAHNAYKEYKRILHKGYHHE